MKKMNIYKTIQLILLIAITILCAILIIFDPGTRNYVAKNSHIFIICFLLWGLLIFSYVFLFLDFHLYSHFRRNVKQLDELAHADAIAGIPNRFSCDSLIEKYIGAPLPPNIGCVMIDITNIIAINDEYGREIGDEVIRVFSDTLHLAAAGQCFIGRNGGNKFIALFENCDEQRLTQFMDRFEAQTRKINANQDLPNIKFEYGMAFHGNDPQEESLEITDLIAHANNRIYESTRR